MPENDTVTTEAAAREGYELVGELVLLTCLLDRQLSLLLIEVFHLGNAVAIEPMIATLDISRKIEILKERRKHIKAIDWKKTLEKYCDMLERVVKFRNIAAHSVPCFDGKEWTFRPNAAAKLLKNIDLDSKKVKTIGVSELIPVIEVGREALQRGEGLLMNFRRVHEEYRKRHPK